VAEALEAVFASGELPGEVGDDDVELGGEGGEVGGGEGEEGGEGFGVGVEEGVVGVLILFVAGGVEDGLGLVEAGEGSLPHAHLVIPDLIRDPSTSFRRRRSEGGSRIKSGMTNKGRSAHTA
jgi:hypothetical protein